MTKEQIVNKFWKPGNIFVYNHTLPTISFRHANLVVNEETSLSVTGYEPKRNYLSNQNISIEAVYSTSFTGLENLTNLLQVIEETPEQCTDSRLTLLYNGGVDRDWDEMTSELIKTFSWGEQWLEDALATNVKVCQIKKELIEQFKEQQYSRMILNGIHWSEIPERTDFWCKTYNIIREVENKFRKE